MGVAWLTASRSRSVRAFGEERCRQVTQGFVYATPPPEFRPPPKRPDHGTHRAPSVEAGARRGQFSHQLMVHKPPNFPERKDRHGVFDVDPLTHGEAVEQQYVATLVEIAQHTGRLAIPRWRKEGVQFARRRPEPVARKLRGPRHQPGNQVPGRDRRPRIHQLHPEIILAHDSSRYRHALQLGVGQQGVARRIEDRTKGTVLGLSTEGPAVSLRGIDHAHVIQRKRRLIPTVDD